MIAYIPQTNFRRKDNLQTGDPDKLITGAELALEFDAVKRSIESAGGTYNISADFRLKDDLPTGHSLKTVSGAELDTEFAAIDTALTALGGSYTPVFDGAAADAADSEITGDPIMDEFEAMQTAITTLRTAVVAYTWYGSYYDSSNNTMLFGSSNISGTGEVALLWSRDDGITFVKDDVSNLLTGGTVAIDSLGASDTAYIALDTYDDTVILRAAKAFPLVWTARDLPTNAFNDSFRAGIAYDSVTGALVAAGVQSNTVPQVFRSVDDGFTWSLVNVSSSHSSVWNSGGIAAYGGRIILVGTRTSAPLSALAFYSDDGGATWTSATISTPASNAIQFRSIAVNGDGTVWVAVGARSGAGNGGQIWYSTDDGATWTESTTHPFYGLGSLHLYSQVLWDSDNSRFVVQGYENSGAASATVAHSADAVSWTAANGIVTALNDTDVWNTGRKSLLYNSSANQYFKGSDDGIWESNDLTQAATSRIWDNQ